MPMTSSLAGQRHRVIVLVWTQVRVSILVLNTHWGFFFGTANGFESTYAVTTLNWVANDWGGFSLEKIRTRVERPTWFRWHRDTLFRQTKDINSSHIPSMNQTKENATKTLIRTKEPTWLLLLAVSKTGRKTILPLEQLIPKLLSLFAKQPRVLLFFLL
ncbi:hypothetical protein LXL04_034563 [Taraxacum kok-saghyz]